MPIDTSGMDEKSRRRFENLTWTAMRYMRDKGLVENNAKITEVTEVDGVGMINFRIAWVDDDGKVCGTAIVLERDKLLDYYAHLMNQVGAVSSPRSLDDGPTESRSPVTLPPRRARSTGRVPGRSAPLVTPMTTWATERARLYTGSDANVANKLRMRDVRLGCICPASVRPGTTTCDHIRWGYIAGEDNKVGKYRHLLDRPAVGQILDLPIGMGHVWVKATLTLTPDKKHFAVLSGLDVALAKTLGWQSQPFFMELDEGLIGYIQYLEDMLSQVSYFTRPFEIMQVTPSAFNVDLITCAVRHGMAQRSAILGALRVTNPDRKNWLLANAVQMIETDQRICLACKKLEVGVNDVPAI